MNFLGGQVSFCHLGSLRNGMDSIGDVCRIEHLLFGELILIKREVCWSFFICFHVFRVGWLSRSSALIVVWCVRGLPCMSDRVNCAVGFGGVSYLSLDTPRGVSCISRKHRQVSWHCAVFSRWRARCVCGAFEVSLISCSSATDDLFFVRRS